MNRGSHIVISVPSFSRYSNRIGFRCDFWGRRVSFKSILIIVVVHSCFKFDVSIPCYIAYAHAHRCISQQNRLVRRRHDPDIAVEVVPGNQLWLHHERRKDECKQIPYSKSNVLHQINNSFREVWPLSVSVKVRSSVRKPIHLHRFCPALPCEAATIEDQERTHPEYAVGMVFGASWLFFTTRDKSFSAWHQRVLF